MGKNTVKSQGPKNLYIYGRHPIELALHNPKRQILEIYHMPDALKGLKIPGNIPIRSVDRSFLDGLVGREATHQGIVAKCLPLPQQNWESWFKQIQTDQPVVVLILDQITDPHNIGAILRSGVAFDAAAVIVPESGTPDETGTLAKSASGALELIPYIRVPNLVRVMDFLKKQGFWCIGLDGYADKSITDTKLPDRCAFIMGSEGDGMRRLTRESCDYCVKLPMNPAIESLNVSNAAALTLYEFRRQFPV